MASEEWLRDGDDRTAECEASRVVSKAPAGGEGGWTGVMEVRARLRQLPLWVRHLLGVGVFSPQGKGLADPIPGGKV